MICFLQVLLVHKALVSLSAWPDTATETQGSASNQNAAPILTFLYAMLHTSFLNLSEAHAFLSIGNQA